MATKLITLPKSFPARKPLIADLIAGLTFSVANIPSAMAHAMLATVNPVFGIYTLMVATPIAALTTSSVFMNVSTTSALAVAVGSTLSPYFGDSKTNALVALVLLIGIIELVLGLLKLGSMLRFVSHSVMVGFSNGVAVLIILGQVSDLTGYSSSYSGKIAQTLDTLLHPADLVWPSLLIGLVTIAVILLANRTRLRKVSAILALGMATLIVGLFDLSSVQLIRDVATLPGALPRPALPEPGMFREMLIPALSLAIVGLVQGAAVSQSYPNPNGRFPNTSRDFLGQGIANIAGSFFQGIPAGGSMSGTALNINSGARTRLANVAGGVFVILIILLFSPLVSLIPMPALAGLVMLAGFQSLNIPAAITVGQTGQVPLLTMALTFILTLAIPLQYAVLVGVAFAILSHIIKASNRVQVVQITLVPDGFPLESPPPPQLPDNQATILMIYGSLFFAASQTIEDALPKPGNASHAVVILGLRGHTEIGSTFVHVLMRYNDALQAHDSTLMLVGISDDVRDKFVRTGLLAAVGEENVFRATPQMGEALNKALAVARTRLPAGAVLGST